MPTDIATRIRSLGSELSESIEMSLNTSKRGQHIIDTARKNTTVILTAIQSYSNETQAILQDVVQEEKERLQNLGKTLIEKNKNNGKLVKILQKLEQSQNKTVQTNQSAENVTSLLNSVISSQKEQAKYLTDILLKIVTNKETLAKQFVSVLQVRSIHKRIKNLNLANRILTRENALLQSSVHDSVHYDYK